MPMTGTRNILVHGYDKVDDSLIYGILKRHLKRQHVSSCPSINGVFRPMPAFSLFAILGVASLRLRLRNRCGLGLNRNPPFLDGHYVTWRRTLTVSRS